MPADWLRCDQFVNNVCMRRVLQNQPGFARSATGRHAHAHEQLLVAGIAECLEGSWRGRGLLRCGG
jgi:hypothetical protein